MTGALVLIVFVLVLVVGYTVLHRRTDSKFLAISEYWVYLPGDQMPPQDQLLDRMVGRNPYGQRGINPIGSTEGLVLSDIRFHMALVLRKRNSHVFRPDLFADLEVTKENLAQLSSSNALIKLRYASDLPLKDKRHLQFLIHAADAMAELGGSNLIYDFTQQKLLSKVELETALRGHLDATIPALHVRTVWNETVTECTAETRGLQKIGLPEIRTVPMEGDERSLVLLLLDQAVECLWSANAPLAEMKVEAYGDEFKVLLGPRRGEMMEAHILRVQAI